MNTQNFNNKRLIVVKDIMAGVSVFIKKGHRLIIEGYNDVSNMYLVADADTMSSSNISKETLEECCLWLKEFKYFLNFGEWEKTHKGVEIYCVTDNAGNELFDVFEDEFNEMVDKGILNGEGHYYLLGNPSKEQIEEYAKQYGIKWL